MWIDSSFLHKDVMLFQVLLFLLVIGSWLVGDTQAKENQEDHQAPAIEASGAIPSLQQQNHTDHENFPPSKTLLIDHSSHGKTAATFSASPTSVSASPASQFLEVAKETQLLFGIKVQAVAIKKIVGGVTFSGVIRVRPEAQAEVVSPVSGRVIIHKRWSVGSSVRQDELLGIVEPVLSASEKAALAVSLADLQARQVESRLKFQQAQVRRNAAQTEAQRAQRLYQAGAISLKHLQEAELQLRLMDQEFDAAQEQSAFFHKQSQAAGAKPRFEIRAPLSGQIVTLEFSNGQQIEAGKPLLKLMNLERMWMEAQVFEKDLALVTHAPRASFRAIAFPQEYFEIGEGFPNHLLAVGALVDPEKRTVAVIYEIANWKGQFRDGMFAELTMDTSGARRTFSIPQAALVEEAGQSWVYVFHGGEVFERRAIQIGTQGQNELEVLAGLQQSERVVVQGISQLRAMPSLSR